MTLELIKMKRLLTDRVLRITMITILQIFMILGIWGQYQPPEVINRTKTYRISDKSTMTIAGTTNMNHFSCSCADPLPSQVYTIEQVDDENCTAVFSETALNIRVESLDCGNKAMNKDMHKTMNAAKYPYIKIKLLQLSKDDCDLSNKVKSAINYSALTRITLNGKSNSYWLKAIVQPIGPNQFRIQSNKILYMTDFGIAPPTAVFGMVKVRDEIRISLDMLITLE